MKTHVIFVEPAQYTLDLIENVYKEETYTFLFSNSKAVSLKDVQLPKAYYCSENSLIKNIKHFIKVSKENTLIISNGYNHWSFILLFFLQFFRPFFLGIESDTPYSEKYGLLKVIKTCYLKSIFRRRKVLGFSGGNGAHKDLFLKYGMSAERVFLLPMMINNQKYYSSIRKEKIQLDTDLVFLYVGRLDPEKNVDALISAFCKLAKESSKNKLIIVGGGACEEQLKKQAENNQNISFKGKLYGHDLISCYHLADVLVLPSLFEPWGLVVNEALSAGLAIICSDKVGAGNDLVLGPDSGWIFNVEDNNELEKTIAYCVNTPNEVKNKAIRGNNFMKNYWNYHTYSQNLQKIKNYVSSNKI